MPLELGTCLRFYKRKDVQDALVEHAKNKEIAVRYTDSFGKRPDSLNYPQEILELAKRGATSLHSSEELWRNPLSLSSEMTRKEQDALRTGWDLVLDIDCAFLDYSKISADLIIKFLQHCRVESISVKFSGNKGFHIGIPFQAFPKEINGIQTKLLFPEAARKIAAYIKENIKEELGKRILEFEQNDFSKIKEKVKLESEEIIRYQKNSYGDRMAKLNVDKFLEIDTILISSRHLYRMPYSLHEKSGLASLPLDPQKIISFEKKFAHPDTLIVPEFIFLDRNVKSENARWLLTQAYDFNFKIPEEKVVAEKTFEEVQLTSPIKEDFFPPCMKLTLNGLEDGKKRAVFALSNFLGKIGWSKPEIEAYLHRWNKEKNKIPLRDHYIVSQLRTFQAGDKLPPNCDNEGYYRALGVCQPDSFCQKIKNPVNYTLLKWKIHLEQKEQEEKKGKRKKKIDDSKVVDDPVY